MFKEIESYLLKKKISEMDDNIDEISSVIEKLQPEDQSFYCNITGFPNRPLGSVLLFLQTPTNMEKYLVNYSEYKNNSHTYFKDRIKIYADLKKSFSKELPQPLIFKSLKHSEKKEICERLSFKIKRFTEFMSAFSVVDEDIKPIMLYYSVNYFLTFLSDMQLHFIERKSHHGLSGTKNLTIKKNGTFARIVDGFFALNKPTLFAPCNENGINAVEGLHEYLMPEEMSKKDNDYIRHIKSVKKLYNKYEYKKDPTISLSDLINMRRVLYKHFQFNHVSSNNNISLENLILVDYLVLFLAGSIARYNPLEWNKIQATSNKDYEKIKYHINAAQTNMLNEWIPYLLSEHILPIELINKLEVS